MSEQRACSSNRFCAYVVKDCPTATGAYKEAVNSQSLLDADGDGITDRNEIDPRNANAAKGVKDFVAAHSWNKTMMDNQFNVYLGENLPPCPRPHPGTSVEAYGPSARILNGGSAVRPPWRAGKRVRSGGSRANESRRSSAWRNKKGTRGTFPARTDTSNSRGRSACGTTSASRPSTSGGFAASATRTCYRRRPRASASAAPDSSRRA